METLDRFRVVKLSKELQQEFDLPEFICADPDGLPFVEGNGFYRWVIEENACEPATASNYLGAVLPFFTFLWKSDPSLRYLAPAAQIRQRIRDYLKEKLGCVVRPHVRGNFMVKQPGSFTTKSARLFLTALRRFYFCATLNGWYSGVNPLEWSNRLNVLKPAFKPTIPPRSGLTLPGNKRGREPDTYFCVVSVDWHPHIIDDPRLRQRLLPAFTQLRDRIIVRILFDSGARIGEVLGLTIADWRSLGQRERAQAADKGSHGERVKEIWWSTDTAQLLRDYINQERRRCDVLGRCLNELPDPAPMFITEKGTRYTYKAFYANWQRACARAQIKITPHQVRHWYVTMALRLLESLADESKRDAYRESLIAYIGWHNPETIKAYDHHIRKLDYAPIHAALARLGETTSNREPKTRAPERVLPTGMNVISEELENWLNEQFGW